MPAWGQSSGIVLTRGWCSISWERGGGCEVGSVRGFVLACVWCRGCVCTCKKFGFEFGGRRAVCSCGWCMAGRGCCAHAGSVPRKDWMWHVEPQAKAQVAWKQLNTGSVAAGGPSWRTRASSSRSSTCALWRWTRCALCAVCVVYVTCWAFPYGAVMVDCLQSSAVWVVEAAHHQIPPSAFFCLGAYGVPLLARLCVPR